METKTFALAPEEQRNTTVDETEICLNGITRVLIGGYDNAGKSTLACSLYKALETDGIETSLYELDRWSDTHAPILGVKSWKERAKNAEVSVEEYADYVDLFAKDEAAIVIGDIEGRYQGRHSRTLKNKADFGILVTRAPIEKDKTTQFLQTQEGWEELFSEIDVPIAIRVHSLREGQINPDAALPIYGLERQLVPENQGVQKLGRQVVELALLKQNKVRV